MTRTLGGLLRYDYSVQPPLGTAKHCSVGESTVQLEMPFNAAMILRETRLREDHPEVYVRYHDKTTVHVGRNYYARVQTRLGLADLSVIRNYFVLWLTEQESIPEASRDKEANVLISDARRAVAVLTGAIEKADRPSRRRVDLAVC